MFELYSIRKKATAPNALLMASWYLAFLLLAFNLQTLTLCPQYTSFGQQFYYNSTINYDLDHINDDRLLLALEEEENRYSCDIKHWQDDNSLCVPTQISLIIDSLNTNYPFFGIINFYGNCLFILLMFVFQIIGFIRCSKKRHGGYQELTYGNL